MYGALTSDHSQLESVSGGKKQRDGGDGGGEPNLWDGSEVV